MCPWSSEFLQKCKRTLCSILEELYVSARQERFPSHKAERFLLSLVLMELKQHRHFYALDPSHFANSTYAILFICPKILIPPFPDLPLFSVSAAQVIFLQFLKKICIMHIFLTANFVVNNIFFKRFTTITSDIVHNNHC